MSDSATGNPQGKAAPASGLNAFFSAAEARGDRWRALHRITKALAGAKGGAAEGPRREAAAILQELKPLEDLNGYPGPRLAALVEQRLKESDWPALAKLVQKVSGALLANSY